MPDDGLLTQKTHWMHRWLRPGRQVGSSKKIMGLLIQLAEQGVTNGRGGPFVAAVASTSGKIISVAHNNVGRAKDSTAHAEILAIRQAQKFLQVTNLSTTRGMKLYLVTTCQPCVMCAGAIYWAGLKRVVAAARHTDAMDGGVAPDLLPDASVLFRRAGIRYQRDIMRHAAASVFKEDTSRDHNG